MKRKLFAISIITVCTIGIALAAYAGRGNNPGLGEVYVTSQGLYYDTFVTANPLPNKGPFQLLENGETEFGPGDPGYVGGRWWIDDGAIEGVQEDTDTFLLCPLLGPGREEPRT